jgi:hypothetical protein
MIEHDYKYYCMLEQMGRHFRSGVARHEKENVRQGDGVSGVEGGEMYADEGL